jgi:hypothetical protein
MKMPALSRRSMHNAFSLLLVSTGMLIPGGFAAAQAAKPAPDTIVFKNGEALTGTLESGAGNKVTFKSDSAGEITVSLDGVKELHASGSFAVLRSDVPITSLAKAKAVVPGVIAYSDGNVTITRASGTPEVVPEGKISLIIDQATYAKDTGGSNGFSHGWNGTINGGATIVEATDYGETLTAGIALTRAMPTVPFLPPRNRTLFGLQETYGKLTSPVIPQTTPASPAAVTETSIFHTGAEQDQYFSPRFYALAQVAFDHNYAQGLSFQQIYGGGIGWTAIKSAKQELDIKATIQYEKQSFTTASGNDNLIGSTISEAYTRTLPKKIVFTESANVIPSFNIPKAYSVNAAAGLGLPVYKRLSFTLGGTDNYLNNPSAGYNKNSFQFVMGVSYALK